MYKGWLDKSLKSLVRIGRSVGTTLIFMLRVFYLDFFVFVFVLLWFVVVVVVWLVGFWRQGLAT